ncbi:MAG: hypothetical protein KDN19_10200 [Verrucomicrobiae bacterium]|nr:hypothetical protein [Verrucomicrobiae bacterium]
MASLLPDSIKHPLITPILLPIFIILFLTGSIWFLVEEFRVSLGWGFGQLGANIASCLLIVPGTIVALVFLCLHWKEARRPFGLILLAWFLGFLAVFMVPSWVFPQ